ncbi:maleylpyruvate isomerase N-terminal domain-containing protein [Nocardia albiluteola]|uniref:maleylpyruvate isomerase N-terminal domain-containing protein n=1 Tax=Nocardia albiluteola TaxID=2842303 RepID=UPI001FD90FAE|nr:maleylpyruvate isomerase N-terminal domain-containing protein [Nocardia albiluteola]
MSSPYLLALRDERRTVLGFCDGLGEAEWRAPSAAAGWSITDVFVHMTTAVRAVVSRDMVPYMTTHNLERLNEQLVHDRQPDAGAPLLAEFGAWSRRGCAALAVLTAPGLRLIRTPIAELGWYPVKLAPAILLFEWHTHLRHDIATALDRPAPATDARRMTAILNWLMTLLEHSHREALNWLEDPVALTLTGPGGGTWRLEPHGGRLRVRPGRAAGAAAHIAGLSPEFPQWSTRRVPWRACAVAVTGDAEIGTRVLDSINLV